MANGFIKIEDYFGPTKISDRIDLNDYEKCEAIDFQNSLNRCKTLDKCYKLIEERRKNKNNIKKDKIYFNIPLSNEVNKDDTFINHINNYYNNIIPNPYSNGRSNIKKFDHYKRNKDGSIQLNKYGEEVKYNKLAQKGINFANNCYNSRVANQIRYIATHWHIILIGILIIIISIFAILIGFYIVGSTQAIGKSPFVLCGSDEATGEIAVQVPNAEVEEMVKPEYWGAAFASVASQKGWSQNAIIGTLSYMLAEGGNSGTFTYESDYLIGGPSGVKNDKTLDNQAWLKWLKSEKTMNDQIYAYRNTSYYKNGMWAMGLGLTQESDVYKNHFSGQVDDGATKLVEAAEVAGVPWQDPTWQFSYVIDTLFPEHSGDSDYVDPTKFSGSAEEYCKRVTAFIGMPGWHWTDSNKYMTNHTKHVVEAQTIFANATGVELGSLQQSSSSTNACSQLSTVTTGGNATIADAAVSLAGTDTEKITWDMDGSNSPHLNDSRLALYKKYHEEYFKGDSLYASCDVSSATAIRWSGADNTFPAHDTTNQYAYLSKSDKWQYVGEYGSCELKPGDVLITTRDENGTAHGHIKIYVGNDAVKKRFPNSDADMYAGSYHSYFPRVYKDDPKYDNRKYHVFRNSKPDTENANVNKNDNGSSNISKDKSNLRGQIKDEQYNKKK